MAYQLTSAANQNDLLDALQTFAIANGWTAAYAVLDPTNGKQLGLSSGQMRVAIGQITAASATIAVTGGPIDSRLYMDIGTAFVAPLNRWWGHTGGRSTTSGDSDRCVLNDIVGPLTEVHFFGDASYIHCLIRVAPARWTHFGFGELDTKGASVLKPFYCFANFFEWWNAATVGGTPIKAKLASNPSWVHGLLTSGYPQFHLRIPSGILNTGLGFAAGYIASLGFGSSGGPRGVIGMRSQTTGLAPILTSADPLIIDMANPFLENRPTTGGVTLTAIPVIFALSTANAVTTWLGEIPGVRLISMSGVEPGQELVYSTETWIAAPWKQKGLVADANNGQPSTQDYGIAFRKS